MSSHAPQSLALPPAATAAVMERIAARIGARYVVTDAAEIEP